MSTHAYRLARSAFIALSRQHPVTIGLDDVSVMGVGADVVTTREILECGYQVQFDRAVEMLTTDFDELNASIGDIVQIDGKSYRVISYSDDASDPCTRVALQNIR